jgi:hypothetical protein
MSWLRITSGATAMNFANTDTAESSIHLGNLQDRGRRTGTREQRGTLASLDGAPTAALHVAMQPRDLVRCTQSALRTTKGLI